MRQFSEGEVASIRAGLAFPYDGMKGELLRKRALEIIDSKELEPCPVCNFQPRFGLVDEITEPVIEGVR